MYTNALYSKLLQLLYVIYIYTKHIKISITSTKNQLYRTVNIVNLGR